MLRAMAVMTRRPAGAGTVTLEAVVRTDGQRRGRRLEFREGPIGDGRGHGPAVDSQIDR